MIPSYLKDSAIVLNKIESMKELNIDKVHKLQERNQYSENSKQWTIRHTSTKARILKTPRKLIQNSSRNKQDADFINSYQYSTFGRAIFHKRSNNTISVKDLFSRENLLVNSNDAHESVLPKISQNISNKEFNKTSGVSNVLSPPSIGRKLAFMFEPSEVKTEKEKYEKKVMLLQKNSIEEVSKMIEINKRLQNSHPEMKSKFNQFMGTHLKEISEKQSASSREMSLDQIDEKTLGIPKGYLNLRKSFKNKDGEMEIGRCKSTFKQRVNRKKNS